MSDEMDKYKVGYKKPPKEFQFKKGVSGNAKGRSSGVKNLKTLFGEILGEQISVTDKGGIQQISVLEGIVKRVASDALKGKENALNRILQYAPQNVNDEQRFSWPELVERMDLDSLKDSELEFFINLLKSCYR